MRSVRTGSALTVILSLVLAGCSETVEPEVEEAAVNAIEPQPILYHDIEKHEIFGASCAFVPEGGGLGAIVIAMAEAGYLRLDSEIAKLAPDPESAELPLGARETYRSDAYSFTLSLAPGEGEQSGYEVREFDAELTVMTSDGEVAYQATGLAQCGV